MDSYIKRAECRKCHKVTSHSVQDREFKPLFCRDWERKIVMTCNDCGLSTIFAAPLDWGKKK